MWGEFEKVCKEVFVFGCIGGFNMIGYGGFEVLMLGKFIEYFFYDSVSDDICLIVFMFGMIGKFKGIMHFHCDLLVICDGFNCMVLRFVFDDIFCGSLLFVFMFGLGGR